MAETKILLRKLALFSLPLVLYAMVIVVVDPYNFLPGPNPVGDQLKLDTAYKLNYAMWKMIRYRHDPVPNILLGDSRMNSLSAKDVGEVSGDQYFNFAYGGGSLREAIDTFYYAHGLTKIDQVYFGINLSIYNETNRKNRVSEVLAAQRNPLIYLVNRNVLNSTIRILSALISGTPPAVGHPHGDKEEFWKFQLDVTTKAFFDNYQTPIGYLAELQDIAKLCHDEHIKLSFIIFPSHMDLQNRITNYGLTAQDQQMRKDLAALGRVYDFSWPNEFTRDRNQFKDPYHFDHKVADIVIEDVWGQRNDFVKKFGQEFSPAKAEVP